VGCLNDHFIGDRLIILLSQNMATPLKQSHPLDFHARISKKVAELTVVVHMLFKRNHEKEVEYEYFKIVAEKELSKIREEYRKKIEWLEKQLDEQEAYRAKVDYQLGDMKNLEEKIRQLEMDNENTRQQGIEKEELLHTANLEISVLKQKLVDQSNLNKSSEPDPPIKSSLGPPIGDQERISKSATQFHIPSPIPDNDSRDFEAIIQGLKDDIVKLKHKHEKELTKSYAEKVSLQTKIDNYTSSLSQEIDELKQTLNILSNKQMVDQKKISEMDKEKRKLEENLKKLEIEKKQLQKDSKVLRDQLKNTIKNSQISNRSIMPLGNAVSTGSPIQKLIESRDQELERLQKEVQMYRMELENREGNFNRMFADKQPVILGPQPEKFLVDRNLTGTRRRRQNQLPKLGEHRSLTFVSGSFQSGYHL